MISIEDSIDIVIKKGQEKIDEIVAETNLTIERFNFVKSIFPDAKTANKYSPIINNRFFDESVLRSFSKFDLSIIGGYWTDGSYGYKYVELELTNELSFYHNDKRETLTIVYPQYIKLVELSLTDNKFHFFNDILDVISNAQNKDVADELHKKACLISLSFIKDNPGFELDKTNMDPRLEKLVIFS